jgi:tRNA(Arg) A34 adenosine deaminase TadA
VSGRGVDRDAGADDAAREEQARRPTPKNKHPSMMPNRRRSVDIDSTFDRFRPRTGWSPGYQAQPDGQLSVPALVGELSMRDETFHRLRAQHDVREKTRGTKRIGHPVVGDLELRYETFRRAASPTRSSSRSWPTPTPTPTPMPIADRGTTPPARQLERVAGVYGSGMTRSDGPGDVGAGPDPVEASPDPVEADLLVRAVQLALDNAATGQLPFGALVVRDGAVLATGVNTALRDHDPVAHAEVAAIRNACRRLGVVHLAGATVYSSCEPCAVCHAVAAAAGVARIVYAAPKEDVPDLGYPAPSGGRELLVRMQGLLRSAAPEQIVYVPTSGATEPFRRFLAGQAP